MLTIRRDSLVSQVRDSVRAEILEGKYLPGTKIQASTLAAQYGVSIVPVREALRALESEGLLIVEPNKGAFVRSLSSKSLKEMAAVRSVLESLALREAASRLTRKDFAELRLLCQRMKSAELDRATELNRRFHFWIFEAAGNECLVDVINQLWTRLDPYLQLYIRTIRNVHQANTDHERILDSLEQGKLENAIRAQEEHSSATVRMVSEVIARMPTADVSHP